MSLPLALTLPREANHRFQCHYRGIKTGNLDLELALVEQEGVKLRELKQTTLQDDFMLSSVFPNPDFQGGGLVRRDTRRARVE
jgi:hypothetical protein